MLRFWACAFDGQGNNPMLAGSDGSQNARKRADPLPKLTERFIAGFKPEGTAKDRLAFDTEVKGLGIRATASGARTFLVQWTDAATARKVREPLGVWGGITLEQAREAARIRLGRVAAGFDPKAEREARKAEDTRQRATAAAAKLDAAYTLDVKTIDAADLWKENMQQFDPWAALEKMRSAHPPLQEQPYLGPASVVFHALSTAHAALEAAHRMIADLYPEVLRIDAARDASIADQELGDANLPPWKRRR
jgi:hypothetical protein